MQHPNERVSLNHHSDGGLRPARLGPPPIFNLLPSLLAVQPLDLKVGVEVEDDAL